MVTINNPQSKAKLKLSQMDWAEENKKYTLVLNGMTNLSGSWTDYSFSFTPDKDGKVQVTLLGTYFKIKGAEKPQNILVCYDAISVEGGELKNGDFEAVDSKNKPFWWWGVNSDQVHSSGAKNGHKFIVASQIKRVSQNIIVKENQRVTIRFSARALSKSI
jgi:hypothetical protein